nr:hypothetical protein CFP56_13489 [Quercus suber]
MLFLKRLEPCRVDHRTRSFSASDSHDCTTPTLPCTGVSSSVQSMGAPYPVTVQSFRARKNVMTMPRLSDHDDLRIGNGPGRCSAQQSTLFMRADVRRRGRSQKARPRRRFKAIRREAHLSIWLSVLDMPSGRHLQDLGFQPRHRNHLDASLSQPPLPTPFVRTHESLRLDYSNIHPPNRRFPIRSPQVQDAIDARHVTGGAFVARLHGGVEHAVLRQMRPEFLPATPVLRRQLDEAALLGVGVARAFQREARRDYCLVRYHASAHAEVRRLGWTFTCLGQGNLHEIYDARSNAGRRSRYEPVRKCACLLGRQWASITTQTSLAVDEHCAVLGSPWSSMSREDAASRGLSRDMPCKSVAALAAADTSIAVVITTRYFNRSRRTVEPLGRTDRQASSASSCLSNPQRAYNVGRRTCHTWMPIKVHISSENHAWQATFAHEQTLFERTGNGHRYVMPFGSVGFRHHIMMSAGLVLVIIPAWITQASDESPYAMRRRATIELSLSVTGHAGLDCSRW